MTEQTRAPARPLYDRLRRIQLENGWTSKQLADRAGIARGTIDNWKTQPRSPLPSTVKDVAARLGIPYREALELAGIDVAETAQAERIRGRLAELDEALASEGTVQLTVHVNPGEPEPSEPPGGFRSQAERIIWALTDYPWQLRLAQIQAARDLEAQPEESAPGEARTTGNRG